MKTYINNFKHLCTLLLTALAFAACSSDNDDIATPEPVQPANGDITFTAVFGVKNPGTRALSEGNGILTASWQQGEEIAIVFGGNKYTATVTEVDSDGSAIVSATLPSGTPNNQAVTFIYPASAADGSGLRSDLLNSQDGTFATLSSELDVASAEGTLVVDGETAQPNGTVTLVNQFAICKFQFKDESDQPIEDITSLTITDLSTTEVINVSMSTPTAAVYVAMKPSSNSTKFELETASDKNYRKTANAHLEAGMFYHPTFKATFFETPLKTPLTFEAMEAGARVLFSNYGTTILEYRINDGDWTEYEPYLEDEINLITLENVGDKVSFRGDNHGTEGDMLGSFWCIAPCYIYGNVMSLLYKENFATATTLPRNYIFYGMFNGGDEDNPLRIYSHPTKDLLLPATTLTERCYATMFENSCLSRAPELPAETLAEQCYWFMFGGCKSLTTAPELRATTLAVGCYSCMFDACTSLTTAPVLPAPTLVEDCYFDMFNGCSNLNEVECLATSFASYSTSGWLNGVSSTGTFTKAAGVAWPAGGDGIPSGWTVVEK